MFTLDSDLQLYKIWECLLTNVHPLPPVSSLFYILPFWGGSSLENEMVFMNTNADCILEKSIDQVKLSFSVYLLIITGLSLLQQKKSAIQICIHILCMWNFKIHMNGLPKMAHVLTFQLALWYLISFMHYKNKINTASLPMWL